MHPLLTGARPPARTDRPLLVVGPGEVPLIEALAGEGERVMQFLCDEDALAWLDEETPACALFLAPPTPEIAGALFDRSVPLLVWDARDPGDRRRILRTLRALEA